MNANEIVELWAKRQVIAEYRSAAEIGYDLHANRLRDLGPHAHTQPIPAIDDITIHGISTSDGETVQIGDMTWDHIDASVDIRYSLDGHGGHARTIYLELEIQSLFRSLVETAQERHGEPTTSEEKT